MDQETKDMIKSKLGIANEGGACTYLGFSGYFSGSKVDLLAYIKDKLKDRLTCWFARTLSQGGNEVLLKAVALAMSVFAMSCFRLPKSTCKALSSAMANFWWNSLVHKRKIYWVIWDILYLAKNQGGLGFKVIESFNQALVAKQAWRLLHVPHCLFPRFIKSMYFDTAILSFLGE